MFHSIPPLRRAVEHLPNLQMLPLLHVVHKQEVRRGVLLVCGPSFAHPLCMPMGQVEQEGVGCAILPLSIHTKGGSTKEIWCLFPLIHIALLHM